MKIETDTAHVGKEMIEHSHAGQLTGTFVVASPDPTPGDIPQAVTLNYDEPLSTPTKLAK